MENSQTWHTCPKCTLEVPRTGWLSKLGYCLRCYHRAWAQRKRLTRRAEVNAKQRVYRKNNPLLVRGITAKAKKKFLSDPVKAARYRAYQLEGAKRYYQKKKLDRQWYLDNKEKRRRREAKSGVTPERWAEISALQKTWRAKSQKEEPEKWRRWTEMNAARKRKKRLNNARAKLINVFKQLYETKAIQTTQQGS